MPIGQVQIFISYAREDSAEVMKLYRWLESKGFKPWMDKVDLLGGEQWRVALEKALRQSDFFLLCLSPQSANKRGFIQREINFALDLWQEKLQDDIYIIPVRIEECEVPDRVANFHWVDWFADDGPQLLLKSLHYGIEKLGKMSLVASPLISLEASSEKALSATLTTSTILPPLIEHDKSASNKKHSQASANDSLQPPIETRNANSVANSQEASAKQRKIRRYSVAIVGLVLVLSVIAVISRNTTISLEPETKVPTDITPLLIPTPDVLSTLNKGNLTLQVAVFPGLDQANEFASRCLSKGVPARVVRVSIPDKGTFYRIQIGGFASHEDATNYGNLLKSRGLLLDDFFVTTIGK